MWCFFYPKKDLYVYRCEVFTHSSLLSWTSAAHTSNQKRSPCSPEDTQTSSDHHRLILPRNGFKTQNPEGPLLGARVDHAKKFSHKKIFFDPLKIGPKSLKSSPRFAVVFKVGTAANCSLVAPHFHTDVLPVALFL